MEPIATYSERFLEVQRQFLLYPDQVVVRARWLLRGRFETSVPLDTLKRDDRRITVRYRLNFYAGWVLAAGALGFAIAFYGARGAMPGLLGLLAGAVGAVGGALLLLTHRHRRTVFARFDPLSGRGGLDIGLAGNDPDTFESFVREVRRQILRRARGTSGPVARA